MDIIFERNIKIEVDNAIKKAIKDYENIDSIDPIKYIGCYTKRDVEEVLETYIGDCFIDMLNEEQLMEIANSPYKNTRELAKKKMCDSFPEKGVDCAECYKIKKFNLRKEGVKLDDIERRFKSPCERCRAIRRMLAKRTFFESKYSS